MFILDADPRDLKRKFEEYFEYLRKPEIPEHVRAFAAAEWYYDPSDHRCPHDSWVQELAIAEVPSGNGEGRVVTIRLSLLGAYHDGVTKFVYAKVRSYDLHTPANCGFPNRAEPVGIGHGDWLQDEIRVSDRGLLLHEVVFSRGSRWKIEAEDIRHTWEPKSPGRAEGEPREAGWTK